MKQVFSDKRLFLALSIEPVEPTLERMLLLKKQLRGYRIKWVEEKNLHLTLFFFGDVIEEKIPVLRALIRSIINDCNVFDFSVTAPGLFKTQQEPKVLWLGINAPSSLYNLKTKIDQIVNTLGFDKEDKKYFPHLTLGRFAPKQTFLPILQSTLNNIEFKSDIICSANKVILFESKLTPTGPIYTPIEIYMLNN